MERPTPIEEHIAEAKVPAHQDVQSVVSGERPVAFPLSGDLSQELNIFIERLRSSSFDDLKQIGIALTEGQFPESDLRDESMRLYDQFVIGKFEGEVRKNLSLEQYQALVSLVDGFPTARPETLDYVTRLVKQRKQGFIV
jgi:hypothetical protein